MIKTDLMLKLKKSDIILTIKNYNFKVERREKYERI